MNWTEIIVEVNTENAETAAAIANMAVPHGIYIEDYSDVEQGAREIAHIDLIDEGLIRQDRQKVRIHIYLSESDNAAEATAFLEERLSAAGIAFRCESAGVDDRDWNENWKKYFKPREIGARLAIVPSWETYQNPGGRTILRIDPGAAFGTGTHATTSLVLELLERYAHAGKTMLDIGCGSGILAIAAVLLGADSALGVDIDAQSVKTARENAQQNGLTDKTAFRQGDLTEQVTGRFDIVCANIVADVIIRLFENAAEYLKPGGVFIVSGIIDLRLEDVLTAARRHGFSVEETRIRENWCALVCKKNTEDETCLNSSN